MKEQVVLSLFNGMNTLRQAMENVGIPVKKYYSSEIKPYAIKLTQHHFPDTIQLGDITKWREWDIDWSEITFIGSGSPCQDLSIAGKRAGLSGDKSSLFYTFIDILEYVKGLNPNVKFLQENVGSANIIDVGIMSRQLRVYPVRINSNLVVAQNRDRYYWSNIRTKQYGMFGDLVTDIPQPKDRNVYLKDIIESGNVDKEKATAILESQSRCVVNQKSLKQRADKDFITVVKEVIQLNSSTESGKTQPYQQNRVYDINGLFPAICTTNNGLIQVKEATTKGFVEVGKGDCVDLAYPEGKTRRGRLMTNKSNCLMEAGNEFYTNNGYYLRKLTQTELERLQGFPDGYTSILSYGQAASVLGDGWTLPIIEHILSFYKN